MGAVVISTTIIASGSTGANGQVLTSGGQGANASWSSINSTTYTWTAQPTFNNTVIVSTTIGLGSLGAVGASGQVLTSQGSGSTPQWLTPTSVNTLLTSTNTWSAQQTYNNTVIISTTIGLGGLGTIGTSGQVLTSQGNATPAWSSVSALLPADVAYNDLENNWSHAQTFGSSVTVSNAALLGAAGQAVTISSNLVVSGGAFSVSNGAGSSGQILQSNGAGSAPTWIASPAATLLTSTNTWSAQQTFNNTVIISTTINADHDQCEWQYGSQRTGVDLRGC
jgi:hypothetical protein